MDVDGDVIGGQGRELLPAPSTRLVHEARELEAPSSTGRGVGPAESTGKSRVTYWPGRDPIGRRARRLRRLNPRDTNAMAILRRFTCARYGCPLIVRRRSKVKATIATARASTSEEHGCSSRRSGRGLRAIR